MNGARRARIPSPLPEVGQVVPLGRDDSKHLCGVLRLGPGAALELFDGTGFVVSAEIVSADKRGATARVNGPVDDRRPPHALHLGLAVLKGGAMDDALRGAVEAGVTAFHPILADRSVATGDRGDRWQRIVEGAAAQCMRADVPSIHAPAPLDEVLSRLANLPARWVATFEGSRPDPVGDDTALLVGPEGGWTDAEVAQSLAAGWRPASLGPWVLRAATAAVVGPALVVPGGPTAGGRS